MDDFVRFVCPACGKSLKAPLDKAGTRVKCPGRACGQAVQIPQPVQAACPAVSSSDRPSKACAARPFRVIVWWKLLRILFAWGKLRCKVITRFSKSATAADILALSRAVQMGVKIRREATEVLIHALVESGYPEASNALAAALELYCYDTRLVAKHIAHSTNLYLGPDLSEAVARKFDRRLSDPNWRDSVMSVTYDLEALAPALARVGGEQAVPLLRGGMFTDMNDPIRQACAKALASMRAASARDALLSALDNSAVGLTVARALAEANHPDALKGLLKMASPGGAKDVDDRNWAVRRMMDMIQSGHALVDEAVLEAIIKFPDDSPFTERYWNYGGGDRIADEQPMEFRQEWKMNYKPLKDLAASVLRRRQG